MTLRPDQRVHTDTGPGRIIRQSRDTRRSFYSNRPSRYWLVKLDNGPVRVCREDELKVTA